MVLADCDYNGGSFIVLASDSGGGPRSRWQLMIDPYCILLSVLGEGSLTSGSLRLLLSFYLLKGFLVVCPDSSVRPSLHTKKKITSRLVLSVAGDRKVFDCCTMLINK